MPALRLQTRPGRRPSLGEICVHGPAAGRRTIRGSPSSTGRAGAASRRAVGWKHVPRTREVAEAAVWRGRGPPPRSGARQRSPPVAAHRRGGHCDRSLWDPVEGGGANGGSTPVDRRQGEAAASGPTPDRPNLGQLARARPGPEAGGDKQKPLGAAPQRAKTWRGRSR